MLADEVISRYAAGERSFRGVDLRGQSFRGQDLSKADFSEADLRGTDFHGARLAGCRFGQVQAGLTERACLFTQTWIAGAMSLFAFSVSFISGVLCVSFLYPPIRAVTGLLPPLSALLAYLLFVLLILWGGLQIHTLAILMLVSLCSAMGVVVAVALVGPQVVSVAVALAGAAALGLTTMVMGGVPAVSFPSKIIALLLAILMAVSGAALGGLTTSHHLGVDTWTAVCWPVLLAFFGVSVAGPVAWQIQRCSLLGDKRYVPFRLILLTIGGWGGTSFRGADLTGADFTGAVLPYTDLRDANLTRTCFRHAARLELARFGASAVDSIAVQRLLTTGVGVGQCYDRMNLRGLYLRGADLRGARIREADLQGANLEAADLRLAHLERTSLYEALLGCADLHGAELGDADLRGTWLRSADLSEAVLAGARIDAMAYAQSGWTPEDLAQLRQRGVEIAALDCFPQEARERVLGKSEGLLLSFNTPLSTFDRFLVEGVIFSVLGHDSDCRVAEFKAQGETAVVRLVASQRADLEQVAEALYRRVWEHEQQVERALLGPAAGLANLRTRLERMELRQAHAYELPARSTDGEDSGLVWCWDLANGPQSQDQIRLPRLQRIFISYAAEDEEACHQFVVHLSVLRRQQLIDVWHKQLICAGEAWEAQQRAQMERADVILLLVSPDFLNSDVCTGVEMKRAFERHLAGVARVIPVILRPADWRCSPLSAFQSLPEDGTPITKWQDRDEAWESVTSALRRIFLHRAAAPVAENHRRRGEPAPLRLHSLRMDLAGGARQVVQTA